MIQRGLRYQSSLQKLSSEIPLIIKMMLVGKSHFKNPFHGRLRSANLKNHLPTLKNARTKKSTKSSNFFFFFVWHIFSFLKAHNLAVPNMHDWFRVHIAVAEWPVAAQAADKKGELLCVWGSWEEGPWKCCSLGGVRGGGYFNAAALLPHPSLCYGWTIHCNGLS